MTANKKFVIDKKAMQSLDNLVPFSAKDPELIKLKHKRIVDGSCKIFFKKGFHPTTIRDIAKACDMSMGQLYHYISSKDDVLFLVHKASQQMWYEHLERFGVLEIESPLSRLRAALRLTLEFILDNKELYLFIYTESKHLGKKQLKNVLKIDDLNVVGFWRGLLEEVREEINLPDDIDLLANLITYIHVFLPLRGWNLKDGQSRKSIDSIIDFVMRGLGLFHEED